MSWFDKLFGEDETSSKTQHSSQKRSQHPSKRETSRELIPQTNDIYQRPRGKFRFPIDMHDDFNHDESSEPMSQQQKYHHETQQRASERPSYTLDRTQRRHRHGVRIKNAYEPQETPRQNSRNQTVDSYNYRKTDVYRANGKRERQREDETRPQYHRPEFRASEVPSAIFGTKERREIKNSGLRKPLHTQSQKQSDGSMIATRSASSHLSSNDKTSSKKQTPNYSKRDNTINIENIYASQIVEEIRREREKKALQKKRFKASLEQKRAAQKQEDDSDIQNAIDNMYAQQAKQLLGSKYESYEIIDSHTDDSLEIGNQQAEMVDDRSDVAVHDDYHYEEVDLSQYEDESVEESDVSDINNRSHVASETEGSDDFETAQSEIEVHTNTSEVDQDNVERSLEEIQPDDFETNDVSQVDEAEAHDDFIDRKSSDTITEEIDNAAESEEDQQRNTIDEKQTVVAPVLKPTLSSKVETGHDGESETVINNETTENQNSVVSEDDTDNETTKDEQVQDVTKTHESSNNVTSKTEISHSSGERPVRRKSKPFNVVMTPSDKKKHMERQKQAAQTRTVPVTEPTEVQNTSQQSSERVSSPEIVEPTAQTSHQQQESQTPEKKIRRGPMIQLPSLDLLDAPEVHERDESWISEKKQELNDAFYYFNVPAEVVNVIEGPSVTRFELSVEKGVKVSRITALQDDIKMALAAKDIRIEAPIPGTSLVGIEVPNQNPTKVNLRAIIESDSFKNASSKLTVAMGNRINNDPLLMDIAKTPHALIAGATGSGKSVSINSILVSLLYRNHPEELKLLLIDPKMVELAPYNGLPHLVAPVITDVKAATQSLKWAVEEMERRYKLFAQAHVRNITAFNKKVSHDKRIPKIVIVIDELADLMMMAPQEVEQSIARIAQKARACGIHMLVATQRPSVNVITGLIKANIPTRIAFMVSSSVDSRTILDSGGAERLLGYGDMLYLGGGMNKPIRVQGTFVSDEEIDRVVDFIKAQRGPEYLFQEEELLKKTETPPKDDLFYEVCEFMVREQSISTSLIQRHFQIGYNRAARIIDQLEQLGYISGANGSKPRDVYLTETELNEL
ncbi:MULTISPECIES: DNA translocase FtsK [unclassified Staphylococcus]|uniref:DNA translocase FtsK n=1 Tax=unclassified Staphylococcus TaxID=91994 RepID=UPI0021D3243F|nr:MULTISPECIES: DNA translocase FtsK [unclassified Staphylococcus]UXR75453.1 DNA translocase FtsK [Staphylococcus sp. IVB6233]UXR79656.1 DNA translocase FtsK [Staphylococcus sp. IVB6218]